MYSPSDALPSTARYGTGPESEEPVVSGAEEQPEPFDLTPTPAEAYMLNGLLSWQEASEHSTIVLGGQVS